MALDQGPVVILVHGAWHQPAQYRTLISALEERGLAVVAPASPSAGTGDSVAGKTQADDVAAVRAAMAPYLDEGRELVLVAHSYGGLVGVDSAPGESVEERRARGLRGGIKHVVWVAGITLPNAGMSIVDVLGEDGSDGGWWRPQGDYASLNDNSQLHFYGDVEPEIAAAAAKGCVRQSMAAFRTKCQYGATQVKAPQTYVVCERDRALEPEAQQLLAAACGASVVRLPCGHCPWLREAERGILVELVVEAAAQQTLAA